MFKNLLIVIASLGAIFSLIYKNNLDNPYIVKPEHYNTETYFPTPSVAVLENEYKGYKIKYFCANHEINNENLYANWKFEQPCEECLSNDALNNVYHNEYKHNGYEWVFIEYSHDHYHSYNCNFDDRIIIGTYIPNNWKNPLTHIKNFDKLQHPYSHGFEIQSIDIKVLSKADRPHGLYKDFENVPKNLNTINYLKEWYYKVPEYDVKKLETPIGKLFGIHYKFEEY